MITKVTGMINRVLEEEVRLQIGPLEYQVLVPDFVRRQIQLRLGQELTLHTNEYLEGNPMQGRVVPRLIGFLTEAELEVFELFCTVDKVGVRKAIKALVRPIREIAEAIQRQDSKWLTTLPGVGGATAEQIVATLRRKVTKFALMPAPRAGGEAAPLAAVVDGNLLEDAYQALLSVGHNPLEARNRLCDLFLARVIHVSNGDEMLAFFREQHEQTDRTNQNCCGNRSSYAAPGFLSIFHIKKLLVWNRINLVRFVQDVLKPQFIFVPSIEIALDGFFRAREIPILCSSSLISDSLAAQTRKNSGRRKKR